MVIKGSYLYKNKGQNFLLAGRATLEGKSMFHTPCFSSVDFCEIPLLIVFLIHLILLAIKILYGLHFA